MRIIIPTGIQKNITLIILLTSTCVKTSAQSPYAMFGDNSKILEARNEAVPNICRINIHISNEYTFYADFDLNKGIATLSDVKGNILRQDSISEDSKALFTTIDPHAENYYHISPYVYCGANPINNIDPDGRDIYMLFYTTGNGRGDEMFKSAAETRKYDIEHSDYFDDSNDIVLMYSVQDFGTIGSLISSAIESYGDTFGKTAEFSVWSHAGKDGPTGTIATSHNALDGKQMTLEGWGNIDFNWAPDANANFISYLYGWRTVSWNYWPFFPYIHSS